MTVEKENYSILSSQGFILLFHCLFLPVILYFRVYLEFERPKSLRQRDSGSTPVLDAVYIALKKRYIDLLHIAM